MTIEEKAIDYAERNYSPSFPFHALKLAYREGATEQQEIDIEKAWRIYNMPVCGSWTKENFTKAMKGE